MDFAAGVADGEISIHAPRMGSDRPPRRVVTAFRIFQSTLPGWGATNPQTLGNTLYLFQSTLPGWGATFRHPFCFPSICISIHAPRMGSDSAYSSVPAVSGTVFQSTLPGWGATVTVPPWPIVPIFQSTLPGWGATSICRRCPRWHRHFNPRSPDGERLCRQFDELAQLTISIHAPRMGSDGGLVVDGGDLHGFQSTLPGWGATRAQAFERVLDDAISIHAPRMGSDQGRHPPSLPATHFNPRSPDGERRA